MCGTPVTDPDYEHSEACLRNQQREYRTVSYLCATLANICTASPNMVIDALTGLLWDEEEAGQIKRANMPEVDG